MVLATASAYFRDHSDATLKSIGFKPTISDPQVYILRENRELLIVSTHVDDFGFAGTSQALIDRVKKELAKTYELSCNPDMSSYLGLNIQRNRKLKQIFINQPGYIDDLVNSYQLSTTLPSYPSTPMRVDYGSRSSDCYVGCTSISFQNARVPVSCWRLFLSRDAIST